MGGRQLGVGWGVSGGTCSSACCGRQGQWQTTCRIGEGVCRALHILHLAPSRDCPARQVGGCAALHLLWARTSLTYQPCSHLPTHFSANSLSCCPPAQQVGGCPALHLSLGAAAADLKRHANGRSAVQCDSGEQLGQGRKGNE